MIELFAHITQHDVPSFWLAFALGCVTGATALAGAWKLRRR